MKKNYMLINIETIFSFGCADKLGLHFSRPRNCRRVLHSIDIIKKQIIARTCRWADVKERTTRDLK